jgi:PIN domain nuclease of toxin-antitoxin system
VRLLLDTHIVLWWLADDRRLPSAAKSAIADAGNELFASAAVGYEIAYKQNLHRLPQLPGRLQDRLQRDGIETLPISLDHALAAASLPGPHRDPWDRIMMAQALAEHLLVATVDRIFAAYGVPVIG